MLAGMFSKEAKDTGSLARAWRRAGWMIWLGIFFPLRIWAQGSPDIIWKQTQNSDRINTVIFSHDGNTVISGSSDRLINFWNANDGTLLQVLNTNAAEVHESSVESVAITSDGSRLCSVSFKSVKLWHLPQNTMQNLSGHTDWVVDCDFSPNNALLATASFDGSIRIWRASDGASVKTLLSTRQMRAVIFSPDGSLLASAGGDNTVTLRRTSDWSTVKQLIDHTDTIYALAFSPDGNAVASASYDKTVKVWNVSDGSLRYTLNGNTGPIYSVAFNPDSSMLAYCDSDGNTVKLNRASDGALLRTYNTEVNEVQALAFSPGGLLAYGRIDRAVVLARVSTTPTASIDSPANGAQFTTPANITINASPSKNDGSIVLMEFFQGSTKLAEDRATPYTFTWGNVPAGTYTLTVRDTDNQGRKTTSGAVTITVSDPQAPSVKITSPNDGATFFTSANITVNSDASAGTGVANVEFFANGSSLGQSTTSPFSVQINSAPAGNYSLIAKVTGNDGKTATSDPVNIAVNDPPPETVKPKVAISSPASGARLTSSGLTLTGTARDNVEVAQVLVALNSDDFRAAAGTTQWQINLDLVPGNNTVKVQSVDTSGNQSAVATRRFTYVVSSLLNAQVNGSGRISPNRDGQLLEVGKRYSISAVPVSGFVFDSWTGDIETNRAAFNFNLLENLSLQANFIPNPFIPVRGIYHGLVQSDPPSTEGAGGVTVVVSSSGAMSTSIYFGSSHYSGSGKFNNDGTFSETIPRRHKDPLQLDLQLHVADDSDQVTGTISDGAISGNISADRVLFNSANPAPQAGRYTVLFPTNGDQFDSPQGTGYGVVTISRSGNVSASGRLADGTPFSRGTTLSKNGDWPFFIWLYSRRGSMTGQIAVRDSGDSDMDGTVNWFRPAMAGSRMFADGFATEISFLGSTFTAPATGASVLNFNFGADNTTIRLGQGGFDSELDLTATLDTRDRFAIDPADASKFRMSISRSSGLFFGTFVHPFTGKSTRYYGAIFQRQNLGAGYFLGAGQSGFVQIQSAQ